MTDELEQAALAYQKSSLEWQQRYNFAVAERDALRKRLDEWVRWGDRMASGHPDAPMASLDHEVRAVIANRYGMSVITAASPALAVQP